MEAFFARNRLSAYLDGELAPAEAREVEQALEHDPELRAEYEALRRTVELLRRHGPRPAPRGFAERLDQRLAEEPMQVGWRRHVRGVRMDVVMLAAAALLVMVVAGQKQGSEPAAEAAPSESKKAPEMDVAAPLGIEEGKTQAMAEPLTNDGVLGNEPVAAAPPTTAPPKPMGRVGSTASTESMGKGSDRAPQKAMPSPKVKKDAGVEKEPYQAEWELKEGPEIPVQQKVYSAPAQYRVVVTGEGGLRELASLASALGGKLVDESGRALAPYPMEPGDKKRVRLMVPAYNAGALAKKLEGLGDVQVLSDGGGLYAPDATVPVTIELSAE